MKRKCEGVAFNGPSGRNLSHPDGGSGRQNQTPAISPSTPDPHCSLVKGGSLGHSWAQCAWSYIGQCAAKYGLRAEPGRVLAASTPIW